MATYNPFNQFVADLANGVHNFSADTIKIALLTSTNPPVATDEVFAHFTTYVATTNLDSVTITVSAASDQTSGTYKCIVADLTMTSTGGNTGPFRNVAIYNDTPTSPADPLIGWYQTDSTVTLATDESLTIDFSTSQVLFTLHATS